MDEALSGYVDAIVFVSPDTGFTVARLKQHRQKELTTIVGSLPGLHAGENILCKGSWKSHPSHGKQYEVSEYTVEAPSDLIGIQKYLESGLVKGIGPVYAKKIVDHFGENTLEVIDQSPHRLLEIEGLGKKKLKQIKDCWNEQRSIREVMVFLRAHGASPGYAQKIYKQYGDTSIAKVRENPYQLAKEVFGIGFKMADSIAIKLGFALHSKERLAAGIEFVLWELANDGHTCYPIQEFIPIAASMLEVEALLIEERMQELIHKDLAEKEGMIWLKVYFAYEQGIAKDLLRIKTGRQTLRSIDVKKAVDWSEMQLSIEFAEEQKEATTQALLNKVHIITGGPGTGKSTITKAILAITSKLTDKILLAAPTGRAAKRLTQITQKLAFTIHALLEMDFAAGGFKRGRDHPLDCDLLILDEASMIDTQLLFHLLRAIPTRSRVLFIGDIDQLPSVGAGTVLRDLIQSKEIGITRLTEIFRQAKGSKIITNAHRINHGEFPDIYTPEASDFHFIKAETPEAISQVILELVAKEIPKIWKYDPIDDIQVLSPMKKGIIGAEMLNEALQNLLNPSQKPIFRAAKRFHLFDKVMQIKNNYDKNVYNGDIGRIVHVAGDFLVVNFDSKEVEYDFTALDELILAYATSIHKYQGSECPCVVIPIHTSHFKLLHRNLLYTAVTRGKRQVYLVGTPKAIGIAVSNNQVHRRFTGLDKAIIETAKHYHPNSHEQLEFANH
ncbi:MAG: recombinase RecD [Chlamydiae bacterium RIFCSPHIGHO2_12_FULL_44_59]|nr:MAG: recombinase RecD [Chlamydiae bacterium RIFCSPHIGHO2_01_FULL_44_39]OGN59093.1 MAG: recombinase RecD [Chlamydiae bacterium RIFCSPHIGHO2_02_FULL_45_9]OGN60291.1 MAG: recombinase RecD [Chlamydiae bacterium RIFCSPHIGHO2_12_FULL_44_59]OGN67056.1 MAG: recombinase RecD [Chlamydiae bacterium RIFCSPLOWO2_01_FULL_44_52]OGN67646.1 MAG: recombinase RecD [Chlamydiae bacterium RIFCSPLOWO2_02_FULL_45_22]OGN71349.1 MAG: recombinase RecD [Chlamydiae bacterium RIFCSPLOWO2_12_FULL_45_20]